MEVIRKLVDSYFSIVKKTLLDQVRWIVSVVLDDGLSVWYLTNYACAILYCLLGALILQVPKAIMHFMVNNTKRGMQQYLIQQLYRCVWLDPLHLIGIHLYPHHGKPVTILRSQGRCPRRSADRT